MVMQCIEVLNDGKSAPEWKSFSVSYFIWGKEGKEERYELSDRQQIICYVNEIWNVRKRLQVNILNVKLSLQAIHLMDYGCQAMDRLRGW